MKNTHIVIMAGGGGTRFWPLSRNHTPKQFLKLTNSKTMLRNTFERIISFVPFSQIWIVTNHLYRDFIAKDIPEIPFCNILVEPVRRDTAAAIMLAASIINSENENSKIVVMPADHIIMPIKSFIDDVELACSLSEKENAIITFGVTPNCPSPQFGYIKIKSHNDKIFPVEKFVEKPTVEIAKKYLLEGNYFWNSGIFIWKTKNIKQQLKEFLPKHYQGFITLQKHWKKKSWNGKLEAIFSELPSISIDYGVMEKAHNILLLKTSFSWNDVGNWEALEDIYDGENIVVGKHISLESKGCIIHSEKQLVATIGIDNIVVVATDDAILVVPKTKTAQVKDLVEILKKKENTKYL